MVHDRSYFPAVSGGLLGDVFTDVMPLFDRVLGDWKSPTRALPAFARWGGKAVFPVDVSETTDGYVIHADMPGVTKDQVEITLDGRRLTITVTEQSQSQRGGEERSSQPSACGVDAKKCEASASSPRVLVSERSSFTSSRSFELPTKVASDTVEAGLKEGVLTIRLKKETASTQRKIEVR